MIRFSRKPCLAQILATRHGETAFVTMVVGRGFTEMVLTNRLGQLALDKPPSNRRTPVPRAVRRIANKAVYSTNDPSLSSFFRLPAELRIEVYRLLLISEEELRYPICLAQQRLVERQSTWRNSHNGQSSPTRWWIRHGLFSSILRTCRLVEKEASDILYGESKFYLEHRYFPDSEVVWSWPLSDANLNAIRRLRFEEHYVEGDTKFSHHI